MRVKLLKMITGSIGHFEAGDVADLPADMALALIGAGAASPVLAVVENTAVSAPETTAIIPAKPGRKR